MRGPVWRFVEVDAPPQFDFLRDAVWPVDVDPSYIGTYVHLTCDYAYDVVGDRWGNIRVLRIRIWDDDERTVEGKSWQEASEAYIKLLRADRERGFVQRIREVLR